MHASWFRYSITKPYPFRWFTPVAIVGGIILTGLFSFLTVATSGYTLQPFYTTFPNATLDQQYWFTKAPFAWRGSLSPTCQPREIPIGSQMFTSNLGFQYELTSISKINASNHETLARLPSLPYLNQVLTDCKVVDVDLTFKKVDRSVDKSLSWWSWGDSTIVSRANCSLVTDSGHYVAVYTTTYNAPKRDFSYVVQDDIRANTSMWWATRLLNAYWLSTAVALSDMDPIDDTGDTNWVRASMTFTTNQTADIQSYDFFSLSNYFILSNGDIYNSLLSPVSRMYNNLSLLYSESLTQGLSFAKIMYSAILVDLGQRNSSNLLLEPALLQWILKHPDDVFRNGFKPLNCTSDDCYYDWGGFNTLAVPENTDNSYVREYLDQPQYGRVLMSEAFDRYTPASSGAGSLGTGPTTIYTQYSCYVPVPRNGGAIFLTVIVAVLVYLRAAWSLLTIIAKSVVEKKNPAGANTCFTVLDHDTIGASKIGSAHDAEDHHRLIALEPLKGYTDHSDHRSLKSGFSVDSSALPRNPFSDSTASLIPAVTTDTGERRHQRSRTTSASRAYHTYLHNTMTDPRDIADGGVGQGSQRHAYERIPGA